MEQDALQQLQTWYRAQCNGDWEHSYGVKIDTLDNPGWSLSIDLTGTSLEQASFSKVTKGVIAGDITENQDWLLCEVKEKTFTGAGGPNNLNARSACSWFGLVSMGSRAAPSRKLAVRPNPSLKLPAEAGFVSPVLRA